MQAATLLRKNDRLREISYFTDSRIATLRRSLQLELEDRSGHLLGRDHAQGESGVTDSTIGVGWKYACLSQRETPRVDLLHQDPAGNRNTGVTTFARRSDLQQEATGIAVSGYPARHQ